MTVPDVNLLVYAVDEASPFHERSRHSSILSGLLREADVRANLTTDAHIAAYAMEHAGTLYSNDGDFARFDGLRWRSPPGA